MSPWSSPGLEACLAGAHHQATKQRAEAKKHHLLVRMCEYMLKTMCTSR
eukprot:SAG11_NODE_661_length_7885_cov_8.956974_5_plen_49_part_00